MNGFKNNKFEIRNKFNKINSLNTDNYDIYVCMKADEAKMNTHLLTLLSKDVSYFPIIFEVGFRRSEYFRIKFIGKFAKGKAYNKCIDKVVRREKYKYFGDVEFDYVLHHSRLNLLSVGCAIIWGIKSSLQTMYQKLCLIKQRDGGKA